MSLVLYYVHAQTRVNQILTTGNLYITGVLLPANDCKNDHPV